MGRDYRAIPANLTVRATTNTAIQFQLLVGTVGIDLTGVGTVQMFLRDNAGGTVGYTNLGSSPKLAVNGTAGGSVTFTPGSTDLVAGSAPYRGCFKVWPTSTTWYYVPEDTEFEIDCRPIL